MVYKRIYHGIYNGDHGNHMYIYIYIFTYYIVIMFYHGNDTVIEWPGINGDIWKVNEHDRIWRNLWLMRNRHLQ